MKARVGDWLVIEGRTLGERRRQGQIIGPAHPDARIEPHPVPPSAGRV